jgi:hypothetical protein
MMRIDPSPETGLGPDIGARDPQPACGAFFARKSNLFLELLQVRDSILKLPFPVVPEFGSDIGPEPWRERKEPLVGGFS